MNNKILKTVEKYKMLSYGDSVVAAVSGGADSMAMLSFLLSVKDAYNLSITVAHIEHGIREKESVDDALFVKQFCEDNSLTFRLKTIDAVKEAQESKMGVEEYSRKVRYDFFNSLGCDKIATAHNLSDNAETLIFRLVRGSGLKGAGGIPPVRGNIIRPLIEVSSEEIRRFCNENGINYRVDSTNLSDDYSRNLIRNKVMPLFAEINSSYENVVNSFICDAREDYAYIEKNSESAYKDCFVDNKLSLIKLSQYDNAIKKRVVMLYFEKNGVSIDRLHLDNVCKIIQMPSKVQIKGNVFAVSNKDFLRIADFSSSQNAFTFIKKVLNISEFNKNTVDFYCDYDKINGSVTVRKRKDGDSVKPAGRGCTKSFKKLFNELSVPVEERDFCNVVCDDDGVIGVCGICCDERVKLDSSTENVFTLKLSVED